MQLLSVLTAAIFGIIAATPLPNDDDFRLQLPDRNGRRVSQEHEGESLLRRSRETSEIDPFKNALLNSLDENATGRNYVEKAKKSRKRRGKKSKRGRKGKKKNRNRRKKKKGRKGKKNKKNKKKRNRKNRNSSKRKNKKIRPVAEKQFMNNLYSYAVNSPIDDSSSFADQKNDARTRKYWMMKSRRSLGKTKEGDNDVYSSSLFDDDYPDLGQREIRASTSIDDLFDSKYDMNCLAWDPLTGRCINSRRSGCFGDSSDDGGLMGC